MQRWFGNVFQTDNRKIRKIRERANRRKLRHLKFHPDLLAGKLIGERIERNEPHLVTRSGRISRPCIHPRGLCCFTSAVVYVDSGGII